MFRRAREHQAGSGWKCPGCGFVVRDHVAADLGFCPRCQDFSGLCAAGRRLVCPDVMSSTTWHTPCTSRGEAAWQVTEGGQPRVLLLCQEHDVQLRTGQAAWIRQATPLGPAGS
jgi:hypothetical protein